ncbi:uncharacterized protein BJ212DRAFT_1532050, partial [Suillus subaureus]
MALPQSMPLEGEKESSGEQHATPPVKSQVDHLGANFQPNDPPAPCHSSHARKESPYLQMLCKGEGTTDGKSSAPPPGIQEGTANTTGVVGEVSNEGESEIFVMLTELAELDDTKDITAMAMAVSDVEGLEPHTIEEACQRGDREQWDGAIKAELMSLEQAG